MKSFKVWVENREEQYNQASACIMPLVYSGVNLQTDPDEKIIAVLQQLGKLPPDANPQTFLARVRMAANGGFDPQQDIDKYRDPSTKRGSTT